MPTVTLLAKAYGSIQLKQVDDLLKAKLEGLRVESHAKGVTAQGWIQVDLSGEDENAATNFLATEIGLCPTNLEHLPKLSTVKGKITELNKSKDSLRLDVGIFEPEVAYATIPLATLQAQLSDGREIALRNIVELFGFCNSYPLIIKVTDVENERRHVESMLAETQLKQLRGWTDSLLDRLIVLGATEGEVKAAVERAGFARDIVEIEPLGLFECAIACKLGTDAAGLIPRIGRTLRNATLAVFNPKKIQKFFEESSIA